ncbi:uncharacterized protein L969DRAFT_15583 [Mixia osmundae IAM 14324]|uniref:Decapping nuclease n=1 Tax=Mixia osmundae (strain CBS 9802 / IAM 14324 / JCM 22182 / KY 12970) TaxID=764103 RepID=G7DYK0_MIXOS|nr:uncharacterized protein L969DRAFT_15583 [Mixia osmundae IAM 14324]KEI41559.1 hypothetical protein L969DRAFT_15583 [Mixia osmundae IAM 14324]GAA95660.1 hypothetical protein E5Q_02316 [Mixia osmundae IAM 14324]
MGMLQIDGSRRRQSRSVLAQPVHLASFSLGAKHELIPPSSPLANQSLQRYREPTVPADLNAGYRDAVWRTRVAEGLDNLTDSLLDQASNRDIAHCIERASVITWRGMMTKLCLSPYDRKQSWRLLVMQVNDCLYIQDGDTALDAQDDLMSYYGYAFEHHCTADLDASEPSNDTPSVNTNVQWCSITKTSLDDHRILIGGEVDCVQTETEKANYTPHCSDFIELKTSVKPIDQRSQTNFERFKLLKFFFQSFLLGVPTILVGFRNRAGTLLETTRLSTLELPEVARRTWNPAHGLNAASDILTFARKNILALPEQQKSDQLMRSAEPISLATLWPVYALSYDAPGGILSISPLSTADVAAHQVALPHRNVEYAGSVARVRGPLGPSNGDPAADLAIIATAASLRSKRKASPQAYLTNLAHRRTPCVMRGGRCLCRTDGLFQPATF